MAEEHQDKPYIENQQQHSRGDYQHAPEKTTTAHEKDPNGGEEEGKEEGEIDGGEGGTQAGALVDSDGRGVDAARPFDQEDDERSMDECMPDHLQLPEHERRHEKYDGDGKRQRALQEADNQEVA